MRKFFTVMNAVWDEVLSLNKDHKLVTVFRDRMRVDRIIRIFNPDD